MICAWCKCIISDTPNNGHGICEPCQEKVFKQELGMIKLFVYMPTRKAVFVKLDVQSATALEESRKILIGGRWHFLDAYSQPVWTA